MITYNEAHQVRLALKMKLSRFCWYAGSHVDVSNDTYYIVVDVKKINGFVRKQIPSPINGVKVKIDLERSK
jgi:hypothetical protein